MICVAQSQSALSEASRRNFLMPHFLLLDKSNFCSVGIDFSRLWSLLSCLLSFFLQPTSQCWSPHQWYHTQQQQRQKTSSSHNNWWLSFRAFENGSILGRALNGAFYKQPLQSSRFLQRRGLEQFKKESTLLELLLQVWGNSTFFLSLKCLSPTKEEIFVVYRALQSS